MSGVEHRYDRRIGERVGHLVYRGYAGRGDGKRVLGLFSCDCGGEVVYAAGRVLNGGARSHCGCKTDRGAHRRHGMRNSREYSSWLSMKARCLDPFNKDYARWGGRGISICDEWILSFEDFYKHLGPRPDGTSLDRIDTTLGYVPGNVRWATAIEQAQNRASSFVWIINGIHFASAREAGDYHGISDVTIHRWVHGYFDARRGTTRTPKEGCYVIPRY